jgi:hypothetical protein
MAVAGESFPSMDDHAGDVGESERGRIADYLAGGHPVVMSPALADDALDPGRKAVAEVGILTDGVWLWPAELAYYVRVHGLAPSPEHIRHMEDNGWRVPDLSRERLVEIADGLNGERRMGDAGIGPA